MKGRKADLAAGRQEAKVAPADPRAGLMRVPPRPAVPGAGSASPPKPEPLEPGLTSSEVFPALQAG